MSKICSAISGMPLEDRPAPREDDAAVQRAVEARAADLGQDHLADLLGPGLEHVPRTCRAMIRGLRPPTLGTSMESSSGTIEVRAQPCFFLIFSASFTGRAERHRHVVGEVLAPHLEDGRVPEGALLEDRDVGGAAADVDEGDAQLLLVGGEARLGRRELRQDGVAHLEAGPVDARDGVLAPTSRRRSRRGRSPRGGFPSSPSDPRCRPGRRRRTPGGARGGSRGPWGSTRPWPRRWTGRRPRARSRGSSPRRR